MGKVYHLCRKKLNMAVRNRFKVLKRNIGWYEFAFFKDSHYPSHPCRDGNVVHSIPPSPNRIEHLQQDNKI